LVVCEQFLVGVDLSKEIRVRLGCVFERDSGNGSQ
jgi:hypothetical protein